MNPCPYPLPLCLHVTTDVGYPDFCRDEGVGPSVRAHFKQRAMGFPRMAFKSMAMATK